jgi:hypothetical protein
MPDFLVDLQNSWRPYEKGRFRFSDEADWVLTTSLFRSLQSLAATSYASLGGRERFDPEEIM